MAVAAGNKFSVALSTTGEVYTWGWNEYGQLGDGNWNEYHEEIISTEDVWGNCCWPADTPLDSQRYRDHKHIKYKRVQDNNNVLSPQKINLKDIVAISAATGVESGLNKDAEKLDLLNDNTSGGHTLALDKNGNVWAWGLNNKGQIGTNTDVKFEQIQLGFTTNGYTNDEGVVEGDSEWHKEYDAETYYTYIPSQENLYITEPTKVVGLEGIGYLNSISEISAGGNSSIAVRNDGYAYAWGNNDNGQLGDGLSDNASMPMQLLSGAKNPYVTYFRDALYVDMATDHAVITTRDGEVYSWGEKQKRSTW